MFLQSLRLASRSAAVMRSLAYVAESSTDAIIVVGPQDRIEVANAAAASMFACRREAMIGALISRYVPLPSTLPGKVIEREATKDDGRAKRCAR